MVCLKSQSAFALRLDSEPYKRLRQDHVDTPVFASVDISHCIDMTRIWALVGS